MKTRSLLALLICLTSSYLHAQTSEFTYQGRLTENGVAANGTYQFKFTLQNYFSNQVASPVFPTLGVTNGLFTLTFDWGNSVFDGSVRFLEIGVRTNGSVAPYTILSPRQEITSTPYAIQAATAGTVTGTISDIQLSSNIPRLDGNSVFTGSVAFSGASGAFSGNGGGLTNVNAATLNGKQASAFWNVDGNSGTVGGTQFVGTTDNQPLELKVNGARALRLEPNATSPNVIGGYSGNQVGAAVVAATISGGGNSGASNSISANYSTIAGGHGNTIQTGASEAAIGGGSQNIIQTNGSFATIPGGFSNSATNYSLAAGTRAKANHTGTFVWADSTAADFSSTANNQFLVRANGGVGINKSNPGTALDVSGTVTATAFSGNGFSLTNLNATNLGSGTITDARLSSNVPLKNAPYFSSEIIATNGLRLNDANLYLRSGSDTGSGLGWYGTGKTFSLTQPDGPVLFGFSGGGLGTTRSGQFLALKWDYSGNVTVNGDIFTTNLTASGDASAARLKVGSGHTLGALSASIAGGLNHVASGYASFIGGGENNSATNYESTVAGGSLNKAWGEKSFVGAGYGNTNASYLSAIGAGIYNYVNSAGQRAFIGSGTGNAIAGDDSSIVGGSGNSILFNGDYTFIGGGMTNTIQGGANYAVLGGGLRNTIQVSAAEAVLAGGMDNTIQSSATFGTISGGVNNIVSSAYGTVAGGTDNAASFLSYAAGANAKATNSGAYVWSDGNATLTTSTNNNSVTMRASGGYRLFSSSTTAGVYLAPGSGAWASLSDRNMKENFEQVNSREVLEKVAALPISTWNYKTQDSSKRHMGPIAQDFSASFGIGENETTITTVDADGVALAAIQGLNEVVKEKDAKIEALEKRLGELEQLVRSMAEKH